MTPSRHFGPAAADALVVAVFVAIGRRSHDEGNSLADISGTAAPFLIGLALGWIALAVTRSDPLSERGGLIVWCATLVAGMILRKAVFDDGTALSFIVVAGVFLALGIIGWRRVVAAATARRSRGPGELDHAADPGSGAA